MTYQPNDPSGYPPGQWRSMRQPAAGPPSRVGVPRPRAGLLGRLGPGQKVALFVGGPVLSLLVCCGGLVAIGNSADPDTDSASSSTVPDSSAPGASSSPSSAPATDASRVASPTPAPASPTTEKRKITETRSIPFGERTVKDSSLAKGKRKIRTAGVRGSKTLTYEVTYVDGVQTGKKLVNEVVTKRPVTQVVAVGTKQSRQCDPNYGGCVPIASDVDCAGGGGNGPAYVSGPVRVIGEDIYRLDRDGDGYGCDD